MNIHYIGYIFLKINSFRLTVSIEASLSDSMRLIDVNGNPHPLTKFQVRMMIMIGWLAFLLAGLMNVLFYNDHPSFVDFSPKRFKEKYCQAQARLRHSGSVRLKLRLSDSGSYSVTVTGTRDSEPGLTLKSCRPPPPPPTTTHPTPNF